ncbi:MAG: sulfide/dihydroorotate dehydrogenase-like FAD/NAD-binding protein [Candidatus Hecatellaceae archaeon]
MEFKITDKRDLNSEDYLIEVETRHIAERWKPGNFVILLLHPNGERVPMSVQKAEDGRISMFIKKLGKTSIELYEKYQVGDCIDHVIGPLGNPVELKRYGNIVLASDLVCGHAENYGMAKSLSTIDGNHVISIQSFPNKNEVYPRDVLAESVCHEYYLTTLDGSYGLEGHYLDVLRKLLDKGRVDIVFAGGDIAKLRDLANLTKPYGIPTYVTVRQIMVDGTGMCGSCRVLVDGEMKLTCIDGPIFNVHKVSFDEVLRRLARFQKEEKEAMEFYRRK